MKAWRQSQILDVIDHDAVASQEELRQHLQRRGIDATQATISRDLKELGLVKRAGDGAYVRPGAERSQADGDQLRRAVTTLMRGLERVDALLVIRTDRGQAQGLAEWIDRAQLARSGRHDRRRRHHSARLPRRRRGRSARETISASPMAKGA